MEIYPEKYTGSIQHFSWRSNTRSFADFAERLLRLIMMKFERCGTLTGRSFRKSCIYICKCAFNCTISVGTDANRVGDGVVVDRSGLWPPVLLASWVFYVLSLNKNSNRDHCVLCVYRMFQETIKTSKLTNGFLLVTLPVRACTTVCLVPQSSPQSIPNCP